MAARRSLGIGFMLALALAVAACGGSDANGHPGAAGTDGHGAEAFPPSTIAFVDASTDMSSTGWQSVRTALGRIPGWAKVEAQMASELAKPASGTHKTSFAKDVRPWLGKEVAAGVLGVTMVGGKPKPEAVAYFESTDDAAAEKWIAVSGKRGGDYKGYHEYTEKSSSAVVAVGNGAVLIGTDAHSVELAIDAREGGSRLADSAAYKDALAKLPSEGVVVGFINPSSIGTLLTTVIAAANNGIGGGAAASGLANLGTVTDAMKSYTGIGMSFYGDANGVGLSYVASLDPAHPLKHAPQTITLLNHAPANAVAFIDEPLGDTAKQAGVMLQNPAVSGQLSAVESATGLSVVNDILPLLTGEMALVVSGGVPIGGSVLLRPTDVAAGSSTMHKITAAITKLQPDQTFSPLPGGVDGEQTMASGAAVTWSRAGDVLAIGMNTGGAVPGPGLESSAHYARTAANAHLAKDLSLLMWFDPARLADMPGVPASSTAGLRSVDGVVVWSGHDKGVTGGFYVDIPPAG